MHTGRFETYCQSAQEALASGVPVIAPRAGGPLDVVTDGVNGLLYEPGSGAELAGHVNTLLADDWSRRVMGQYARAAVLGRSWESVNDRLLEHYRSVLRHQHAVLA